MTRPAREQGRSARMRAARLNLGADIEEFAALLDVRTKTLMSWEAGRDAIPASIWTDIDRLYERFDQQVAKVLAQAIQQPDEERIRVRVWRRANEHVEFAGFWHRVVAEAMRRDPRIEPVYPEDDQDAEPGESGRRVRNPKDRSGVSDDEWWNQYYSKRKDDEDN